MNVFGNKVGFETKNIETKVSKSINDWYTPFIYDYFPK